MQCNHYFIFREMDGLEVIYNYSQKKQDPKKALELYSA